MKHIILLLSLFGLAVCGDLSNEYLPPSSGVVINSAATSRSFGQFPQGTTSGLLSNSRLTSTGTVFGSGLRPSSQYGAPNLRSQPASPIPVYGAPTQYSTAPSFGPSSISSGATFRSQALPSVQYGTPSVTQQRTIGGSQFGTRTSGISGLYGAPSVSGTQSRGISTQYGAPSVFGQQKGISPAFSAQVRGISTQYGAPSTFGQIGAPAFNAQSRGIGTQYGAPSAFGQQKGISAPAFNAQVRGISTQYGAPSTFGQIGAPAFNAQSRGIGTQYGAPSAFTQQQSIGEFGSQSRGISTQYGAPQVQTIQPSASFRAGPQLGGLSGVAPVQRPAFASVGTIQDSNGGYVY